MAARPPTRSSSYPVRQTDHGLHLVNSILWLDGAAQGGDLSFLSSAHSKQLPKNPQTMASEGTIALLEAIRKRPEALVCQFNRPFSLGKLKLELLPSGCILGGASLYIETENNRVLYAPHLQVHRIPVVRQMQVKKAHTLILGASHPVPTESMPNRKKEKERLIDTVDNMVRRGLFPVIFCEAMTIAPEITKLLSDNRIPLAVHNTIFRINEVYARFGAEVGNYTRYSREYTKSKVCLFPLPANRFRAMKAMIPDGPVIFVEPLSEESFGTSALEYDINRYYLGPWSDGPELLEVVQAVGPKEVYFCGPYARRYSESLGHSIPNPRPLYSNNIAPLF